MCHRERCDIGQGDVTRFPADELECWYRLASNDVDEDVRILGDALNEILHVREYQAGAWYIVTNAGVRKL